MQRTGLLALLIGAACAGAVAWLWSTRASEPIRSLRSDPHHIDTRVGVPVAPDRSAADAGAIVTSRQPRSSRSVPPLSAIHEPSDTPLPELIDRLAERADRGDMLAACRLAWDLDLCRLSNHVGDIEQALVSSAAEATPGSADWLDSCIA